MRLDKEDKDKSSKSRFRNRTDLVILTKNIHFRLGQYQKYLSLRFAVNCVEFKTGNYFFYSKYFLG